MIDDIVLLKRDDWEPVVFQRGELIVYHLPVESGFVSFNFEFEINQLQLSILRDDKERYYFLFAALHHPFQLKKTQLTKMEVEMYFQNILQEGKRSTEEFLSHLDTKCNGCISSLASRGIGRDLNSFRSGKWFK